MPAGKRLMFMKRCTILALGTSQMCTKAPRPLPRTVHVQDCYLEGCCIGSAISRATQTSRSTHGPGVSGSKYLTMCFLTSLLLISL